MHTYILKKIPNPKEKPHVVLYLDYHGWLCYVSVINTFLTKPKP